MRDDASLQFAVDQLDLIAEPLWRAVSMGLDDAALVLDGIVAARELAMRASARSSAE